ncbi:capsid protein [Paslahepevirus balayani]|uniref:Pro-secreted protein ORF2 n=1 Tax=little egret hepatitis E virus TaxID=3070744 RepID=A0AA47Z2K9_9VIRU|nr:capsid protein [Paslahepevirus balayani]APA34845.1 capsid protein [little egret hepatitis E virus]
MWLPVHLFLLLLQMLPGVSTGVQTGGNSTRRNPRRRNAAWAAPRQGPNTNSTYGATPLTKSATAVGTRPVPDVNQAGAVLRRQYNLVTSPLSLSITGSTNSLLYGAPVNPLMPLQDGSTQTIMSTESSNYAQYRVKALTFRWRPVVPNAVGGFSISLAYWPQATSMPTSVDMNSITSTDVRIVLQPGTAGELVIPSERLHYKNQGWRSVETQSVPQEDATSGVIMVTCHGSPMNSYINQAYTGPLGMLDIAMDLELRNLSPGNTNARVTRTKVTARHKIQSTPGGAIIPTAAALRFMNDAKWGLASPSEGDTGHGVLGVLFNIADTILGGLPSTLLRAAGGQFMYGRPVGTANGEPAVRLYATVEDAINDRPLTVPHDIDLGDSTVVVQDYDNQHVSDRPSPAPAPKRALGTLRVGDVLRVDMPRAQYVTNGELLPQSVAQGYITVGAVVHNLITGVRAAANTVDWTQATVDGVPVKVVGAGSGSQHFAAIPACGKPSFWGAMGAGYFYNYNNTHQEWLYFSQGSAQTAVAAYTNMLGNTADISFLMEVRAVTDGVPVAVAPALAVSGPNDLSRLQRPICVDHGRLCCSICKP